MSVRLIYKQTSIILISNLGNMKTEGWNKHETSPPRKGNIS